MLNVKQKWYCTDEAFIQTKNARDLGFMKFLHLGNKTGSRVIEKSPLGIKASFVLFLCLTFVNNAPRLRQYYYICF